LDRTTKVWGKEANIVATAKIPKYTFLGEYGGDLIPMKFANLIKKYDSIFKIGNFYIGPIITANWAVLMNHSKNPNIRSIEGTINGKPGIYFYNFKDINPGESLLYDYGKEWMMGKNI
jgi:SET domain-containing protein